VWDPGYTGDLSIILPDFQVLLSSSDVSEILPQAMCLGIPAYDFFFKKCSTDIDYFLVIKFIVFVFTVY
jgi:hypothetical protein